MAREMKDSGVEWIGNIPKTWTVGRIGQLYTERREKVSDKDYQPLSVTMDASSVKLKSFVATFMLEVEEYFSTSSWFDVIPAEQS